jgi:sterol desaturase/sphingolipid hydroxylase (fatty acid hydroxylase superfamily)
LGSFLSVFLVMGLWEVLAPRRALTVPKTRRWFCNLGIVVIDSVVLRAFFPLAAVGMAVLARENHWGLFNVLSVPYILAVIVSVFLLDFIIYLQHVVFHVVPLLWRVHRMHHTDRDLDVTSGLRFHPIEIVLSMMIKMVAVGLVGPPPLAVIAFEVLLNATAMFNHGNVCIPLALDRVLRWFLVTPDMHRVHHSVIRKETDSNFGFNLPWWDRLLGTYRAQPERGHDGMVIGLPYFQNEHPQELGWILLIPFRRVAPKDVVR